MAQAAAAGGGEPAARDEKAERAEKAASELKATLAKREKERGRPMTEKEVRMETLHARLRVAFRDAVPSPRRSESAARGGPRTLPAWKKSSASQQSGTGFRAAKSS